MFKAITEEWKSYTKRQKIILSAYAFFSLPMLPIMGILIPFSHWVTQPDNKAYRRKLTLFEFICMSWAMSLLVYLGLAIFHFAK